MATGNLATFDHGGLKFPFSFFESDKRGEIQRIIQWSKYYQMKKKNLANLRKDVRNIFSAYRFKADFCY